MNATTLFRRFREATAATAQSQLQRGEQKPVKEADPTDVAKPGGGGPVDADRLAGGGASPLDGTIEIDTGEPVDTLDSNAGSETDVADDNATGDPQPQPCPACEGTGTLNGDECSTCGGTGELDDNKTKPNNETLLTESDKGERFHLFTPLRESAVTAGDGYEVTIIGEGLGNSEDSNYYTKAALREAVTGGLFEGLRAYADHPSKSEERDRPERSVRDLVGSYRNARYREVGGIGEVVADFVPFTGQSYQWVRDLIDNSLAAVKAGLTPPAGISVDGGGVVEPGALPDGRRVNFVREVTFLPSADIVTRPGAGGKFNRRLLEAVRSLPKTPARKESHHMKPKALQDKIKAQGDRLRAGLAKLRESDTQEALDGALTELSAEIDTTAGLADVELEVTPLRESDKGDTVPVTRFREVEKERDDAQTELAKTKNTLLAARLLREAEVPESSFRYYFDELVSQDGEEAMKGFIARKSDEERAVVSRVRESLGYSPIEGAGARLPEGENAPDPVAALEGAGIPTTAAAE